MKRNSWSAGRDRPPLDQYVTGESRPFEPVHTIGRMMPKAREVSTGGSGGRPPIKAFGPAVAVADPATVTVAVGQFVARGGQGRCVLPPRGARETAQPTEQRRRFRLVTNGSRRLAQKDGRSPCGGTSAVRRQIELRRPLYSRIMTNQAEALLREALGLPEEDRADVAAELLASLDALGADDPATVRSLWAQELERRARRMLSGEAVDEDWSSVRQRLAAN